MRNRVARLTLLALLAAFAAVGSAAAQDALLNLVLQGLPPGTDVSIFLSAAGGQKTDPPVSVPADGQLTLGFDSLNFYKPQREDEQISVVFPNCPADQPVVIAFVAEGGEDPCDHENLRDVCDCDDDRVAVYLPRTATGLTINPTLRTVRVEGAPTPTTGSFGRRSFSGFRVYGGVGGGRVTDAMISPERRDIGSGFFLVRQTDDLDPSAKPMFHVGADYWWSQYVGGFVSFNSVDTMLTLGEDFVVERTGGTVLPDVGRRFDGRFHGYRAAEYGVKVGAAVGPAHFYAIFGGRTWSVDQESDVRDFIGSDVQEFTKMQENSSTNFIYGGGLALFLTNQLFVGGSVTSGDLTDTDKPEDEEEFDEHFPQGVVTIGFRF